MASRDRTGRQFEQSWAGKISLVTLLTVVFGAGAMYYKLDALAEAVRSLLPRIEALEHWRAAHEASSRRRP